MKKWIPCFVFLIVGCAHTNVVRLSEHSYGSKPEGCKIDVLNHLPSRKFEEIAMLNARGGQSLFEGKSVEALIPDLKKKACEVGADAIIIKNAKEGGFNFDAAADRAEATATAIKYVK